jgi:hypothetical protein
MRYTFRHETDKLNCAIGAVLLRIDGAKLS